MAAVKEFIDKPDATLLSAFTKDQLIELATHYGVPLSYDAKRRKYIILSALIDGLVEEDIISEPEHPPGPGEESDDADAPPNGAGRGRPPTLKPRISPGRETPGNDPKIQELQLRRDLGELEFRREELRVRVCEEELVSQLEIAKLQFAARKEGIGIPMHQSFDVARHIKLVPPFNEKDVDRYFVHFERVATSLA